METVKKKFRTAATELFKSKKKSEANQPDLQAQFEQQRSGAKGAGVNPFDLPWGEDEPVIIEKALDDLDLFNRLKAVEAKKAQRTKKAPKASNDRSLYLPDDLKKEIIRYASKPIFIRKFCIDMETAGEIERILDQDPALKSAMSKFPSAIKSWSGSDFSAAPERSKPFTDIAAEILNSPAIPAVLKDCVETEIDAILMTTDPHKRFAAASLFLRRLAGFGIKTD